MNSKRGSLILFGSIGLVVLSFIIIAYSANNLLAKKSQQVIELKLQNHTADSQLTNLSTSKKQVEQFAYFNDVAKTVLPSDKDQARAVLEIYQIANEAHMAIQSVTFPESTLGLGGASTTAPATGAATAGNAATAPATTIISQAKPVPGISGLYSIPITITPQSDKDTPADKIPSYDKFLDFMKGIEQNRRTAQISSIVVTPESDNAYFSFILTVNIFIKPGT